jgi:transcriptional regulator with XRE-family HTH domain
MKGSYNGKIGSGLRALRREKGMTQVALAQKVGMAQSCISKIEANKQVLTLEQLHSLSKAFGESPGELLRKMEAQP